MKARKILIVTHYYPPHTGGIEYVAHNQAKSLAQRGAKVTVITSRVTPNETSEHDDKVNIIRIRAINIFEGWGVPFPVFSPRLVSALIRTVKDSDVVHIHDAFYISSWCAALIGRLYRRPVVLTQHVDLVPHSSRIINLVQRLVYATAGKLVFKCSANIIVINFRVKDFLVTKGVSVSKIRFLVNGVDSNLFHPGTTIQKRQLREKYGLSKNQKIVLFVGRLVAKKGFDKVLAAESQHYQLVIVGGRLAQASRPNIHFMGKLTQPQLAEIYRAADIFVLPGKGGEGFPLAIQEAMASGLPVIMSDDSGYATYKLDKRLVCLLKNDPSAAMVRQAINTLVDDETLCRRLAQRSLAYTRKYFAWPQVACELDKIYQILLLRSGEMR